MHVPVGVDVHASGVGEILVRALGEFAPVDGRQARRELLCCAALEHDAATDDGLAFLPIGNRPDGRRFDADGAGGDAESLRGRERLFGGAVLVPSVVGIVADADRGESQFGKWAKPEDRVVHGGGEVGVGDDSDLESGLDPKRYYLANMAIRINVIDRAPGLA